MVGSESLHVPASLAAWTAGASVPLGGCSLGERLQLRPGSRRRFPAVTSGSGGWVQRP